ncbi:MAG: class I SAM-dependent methyltransferase [Pyrinomonadaceae bacterium]
MTKTSSNSADLPLKALLRRARASFEYRTGITIGRRDPLAPPAWLHGVGDSDFVESGEEFFRYFIDLAALRPDEQVLDIGCGTGRMARPLTKYLTSGSYDGIDIVAPSIEWCEQTYGPRFPNFHFHFSDIYNKAYNPAGKHLAAEYRFPFAAASFDFIFLTSVFTHMLPADLENYLSEITRVLKPGGRCLITYFLLNEDSLQLIEKQVSSIDFKNDFQGCRVKDVDVPEAAVAYEEQEILRLYEKHKLNIAPAIRYGSWSGREDGLSFQDMIVAIRRP